MKVTAAGHTLGISLPECSTMSTTQTQPLAPPTVQLTIDTEMCGNGSGLDDSNDGLSTPGPSAGPHGSTPEPQHLQGTLV